MFASANLQMTRRCFFLQTTLAAAVPSAAAAWLAAPAPVDAASDSPDTPDLPAVTLLNSGEAPAYLPVFHTGQDRNN
ncbi:MAG TPA: hypothetical protein VK797_30385 [Tepidisphaeraceae bacterium]|jgi:hypothetical protein|nr:hypothetical protein [Tepidisphaeraceae bacterium]